HPGGDGARDGGVLRARPGQRGPERRDRGPRLRAPRPEASRARRGHRPGRGGGDVIRQRSGRGDGGLAFVTAEEAVAGVRSGERVFVQGAAATPETLLRALTARAGELVGVRVVHLHIEGAAPHLDPAVAESFRHEALFVGPNARRAVAEGRAEY